MANNPSLPVNDTPALPPYRARNVGGQDMVSSIVGFDVQNQRPIDGRSIVKTRTQRNNLRYAYFGLKVFVIDEDKEYRFINANYQVTSNFVPFIDADWKDLSIATNQTFIGVYDTLVNGQFVTFAPALPIGGAYFTVKTPNNAPVNMVINAGDPPVNVKSNGQIIYNVPTNKWVYVAPLEPEQITQFPHTSITDWNTQIQIDIANYAIVPYVPAQAYINKQVVRVVRLVNDPLTNTNVEVVDLYQALRDIVIADNITDAGAWKLISSTDYTNIGRRLRIDNTKGNLANVQNPTSVGGDDVTLSANEIDRRIGNNSGGRFPINGGNAFTPDEVLGPKIFP